MVKALIIQKRNKL